MEKPIKAYTSLDNYKIRKVIINDKSCYKLSYQQVTDSSNRIFYRVLEQPTTINEKDIDVYEDFVLYEANIQYVTDSYKKFIGELLQEPILRSCDGILGLVAECVDVLVIYRYNTVSNYTLPYIEQTLISDPNLLTCTPSCSFLLYPLIGQNCILGEEYSVYTFIKEREYLYNFQRLKNLQYDITTIQKSLVEYIPLVQDKYTKLKAKLDDNPSLTNAEIRELITKQDVLCRNVDSLIVNIKIALQITKDTTYSS